MTEYSWKLQKSLTDQGRLPFAEEVRYNIVRITHPKNRFVCAVLYLTGSRASEITKLERQNIWSENIHSQDCLVFRLVNRKNKRVKQKLLPIKVTDEPQLCKIVFDYLELSYGNVLIPAKRRIYDIVKKELGWPPHFLRHLRLTHLTVNKKYTELQLTKWAGWTDARPATTYVSMNYRDLV